MLPRTLELYVLPFLFVISGIDSQRIFKMPTRKTNWLDDSLGYDPLFVPVFAFSVKKADDAVIRYFDQDNNQIMQLILGGWYNTKTVLHVRTTVTSASAKRNGRFLDKNNFRKFKLEYKQNVLQLYRHSGIQWKLILKINNVEKFEPVRGKLESKYSTAEWKIQKQDINTKQTVWEVGKTLQNIRILEIIVWTKDAQNIGRCALLCYKDNECKSFNFNRETNACQGHLENYATKERRLSKAESHAAHYYIYEN